MKSGRLEELDARNQPCLSIAVKRAVHYRFSDLFKLTESGVFAAADGGHLRGRG